MKKLLLLLIITSAADMAAAQRVLQFAKKVPWMGITCTGLITSNHVLDFPIQLPGMPDDYKQVIYGKGFKNPEHNIDLDKTFEAIRNQQTNNLCVELPKKLGLVKPGISNVIFLNTDELNKDDFARYYGKNEHPSVAAVIFSPKINYGIVNLSQKDLESLKTYIETGIPNRASFLLHHELQHINKGHNVADFTSAMYKKDLIAPVIIGTTWYASRFLGVGKILSSLITFFSLCIGCQAYLKPASKKQEKEADLDSSNNPQELREGAAFFKEIAPLYKDNENHFIETEIKPSLKNISNNSIKNSIINLAIKYFNFIHLHPHPLERARYLEEKAAQLEAEQQKENK